MTEIQKSKYEIEQMLKKRELKNKFSWKRKYQIILDNARSDIELDLNLLALKSAIADQLQIDLEK